MNILGISGQDADAAAALVRDGVVVAAIEEEKLARIRHIGMNYSGGLPSRAIEFCLTRAGISFDEVDYVAYYLEPYRLFRGSLAFRAGRVLRRPGTTTIRAFPYYAIESLNNLRQRLRTLQLVRGKLRRGARVVQVNHQLAHGASAYYASGFDRAAVVVAGNKGDMTPLSVGAGAKEGLRVLKSASYPDSLGMVYGAVTSALGFTPASDEHKTMWLSATGQNKYSDVFRKMVQVGASGLPEVDLSFFDRTFKSGPLLSRRFFKEIDASPRRRDDPISDLHRDIAASMQSRLEEVLCEVAVRHRERTGEENLCLAGGIALNSLAVSAVERKAGFKHVFVQPAAGNAGCSIGAALYVWHDLLGNRDRWYEMKHAFLGPVFDEEETKAVLDNCKLDYQYVPTEDRMIAEVARVLSQNQIVGWFRGAMEFGPRTLGARSILASPLTEFMADNLNTFIKHREEFRPFSAAVPEERASEFFESSDLARFLQSVSKVKDGVAKRIPAAIFGDRLVRVQTVSRETNPSFWKLLAKFGEMTGTPVLLNTSFNLFGEPVVSTPREAVRGFYCSGVDCLAIGNFLIEK
ncbi:MAG TPA: carbamoyltransferase C-terminal domain-containing protein [Blastocatellia bacterium]|nr:carbamoyltransferase C-terminal domain-containing protein [Blastocatellia bacterium]